MTASSTLPAAPAALPHKSATMARLVGIDFARFLAIIGMMCAHLLPQPGMPGHVQWVSSLTDGNASTLFAVIGGISVVLATRRYLDAGLYAAAAWAMAARGVMVIVIGASLATLPMSVVIVLVYFGVAMLCTIPFLRMPARWLLAVAAVLALVGPFANATLRGSLEVVGEAGGLGWPEWSDPLVALRGVFITGTYPVVTWLAYLLIGMAFARLLLAARTDERAQRSFIFRTGAIGAAMAALSLGFARLVYELGGRAAILQGAPDLDAAMVDEIFGMPGFGAPSTNDWWWMLGAAPHTGTTLDIVRGVGIALFVIALMLAFARWAPRALLVVLRPVSAAGAAPLTIYTVHVLGVALTSSLIMLLGPDSFTELPWWYLSAGILAVHVAVVLIIGCVLAALKRRGPLEALIGYVAKQAARLGAGSRSARPPLLD